MMGVLIRTVTSAVLGRSLITVLHLTLLLPAAGAKRQLKGPPLNCSHICVCASNIISCSNANLTQIPTALPKHTAVLDLSFNSITQLHAEWTPVDLSSLQSLVLSNNGLTFLSTEAFMHVTKLRYLDLSFNGLRKLDEFIFEPLERLEVLLLFKNNISQIDRTAFSGLNALQRLYMSHNLISRFPMEVLKERSRTETFKLIDVSSNRLKFLPLQEIRALRAWIKKGIYFHDNPLTCSCELYDLLAQWHIKELSSATDFTDRHTCVKPGLQKERMRILDLDKDYLNCTEVNCLKQEAYLEQSIQLDCDTRQKNMVKRWAMPENASLSLENKTAVMLGDGRLRIGPLRAEDSGVYTCYATSGSLNETLHITVVVFNYTKRGGLENLKTAYTTLVASLVSIVMVLIYLYVTPCRCPCCPGQDSEKDDPGESLHSSTVSLTQAQDETERGAEGGSFHFRQAAPLGRKDQLNGRLNPIGEEDEEWQGDDRKRQRPDAESVRSVCSDVPMVL